MKNLFLTRILGCLVALLLLWPKLISAASFTPGNIVVVRIGDGTAAIASGVAGATFLVEYTPSGTLVQTIALPTAVAGANHILTNTASSSTDGAITRSVDGRYLVLTGYDAAPGTAAITGTVAATTNRVIGRVAADGTVDTSTRINDAFGSTGTGTSTGSIRDAATVDGSNFYAVGSNSGVRYLPFGNTGATTAFNTAAPTNLRTINIFGGNLYITSATTTFDGISQVGTGLPTSGTQTITVLPGFPTATGPSPYAFYFADLSSTVAGVDVVYVADDRLPAASPDGGIQKWSLVAGTWVKNGVIPNASSIRSLTGSLTGTTVSLVAGTDAALYALTDNAGYNAAPSNLTLPTAFATAPANTKFRGVALAPVAAVSTPAPTITSFTPATGAVGTSVTITGTNFTGATTVTLNGVAVTGFVVVNATTITFTVPATATSGAIAVTTAGGTATSTTTFTVRPTGMAPTITSFTPTSGPSATSVTITGTNFTGATAVTLNGVAITGFVVVNATTITFVVPATATSGAIAVTTPGGTAASTGTFTVSVATPAPTITSFTPTTGASGTSVTITGTNFTGATAVTLNGVAITGFVVVNATTITFVVPATATSGAIAVTTPGGTATSTGTFTIGTTGAVPTISSFAPARAVAGGPAVTVTISGTGLTAGTTVSFNGGTYPATVVGTAGTSVTVVLPATALTTVGTYPITVTNGGGTSTSLTFLIVAPATTTVYEDFEMGTKAAYAAGNAILRSGIWNFSAAVLGNLFNDRVNQVQAARIRPAGFIAMNFDKPNGAGIITVNAAMYGADTGSSFTLELSTDGGNNYAMVPGAPTNLTNALVPYTFSVNQAGPVRLRITNTAPASANTPRINIDDLDITDYIITGTQASQALPGLALYPNPTQNNLTVILPQPGAAQVAVRDLTGRVVLPLAPLAASGVVALPASLASGIYLLEVQQGTTTAVRRITKE